MTYLLDTNVVSEAFKRRPSPQVMSFLAGLGQDGAHISVLTLGELRRGAVKQQRADPVHGAELLAWLREFERIYAERTIDITPDVAHRWGSITADRSRPAVDSLIAATALVHDLIVVTRNERDFRELGVPVLNPWA